jgi:hypothetical protein
VSFDDWSTSPAVEADCRPGRTSAARVEAHPGRHADAQALGVGGRRLRVERRLARVAKRHQHGSSHRGLAHAGDAAPNLDLPPEDDGVERRTDCGVLQLRAGLVHRGAHLRNPGLAAVDVPLRPLERPLGHPHVQCVLFDLLFRDQASLVECRRALQRFPA